MICNQKFNANLYYANGNSQTKPYKTLKPQLDWFNSLSLEKIGSNFGFCSCTGRECQHIYTIPLYFLQGQHQVTIDQIYQLQKQFYKKSRSPANHQ